MFDKFFKESKVVYGVTIGITTFVSIIYALSNASVNISFIEGIVKWLPFYDKGLGWVLPALFGLVLGMCLKLVINKISNKDLLAEEEVS